MRRILFNLIACIIAGIVFVPSTYAQTKKITPQVIPETNYVLRGGIFKAKLVPVANNLVSQVHFYVNGKEVKDGNYSVKATRLGRHRDNGYMLIGNDTTRYPFVIEYSVGEPSFELTLTDNNVLYKNYSNRVQISVPGVANNNVLVTCSNNVILNQRNGLWEISPTDSCGKSCTLSIAAMIGGQKQSIGSKSFKVLPLPNPCIRFTDGQKAYGGADSLLYISKAAVLNPKYRIEAAYDKSLNIIKNFSIAQFSVKFADGEEIVCAGKAFNTSVLAKIEELPTNSMLIIKSVRMTEGDFTISPIVLIIR